MPRGISFMGEGAQLLAIRGLVEPVHNRGPDHWRRASAADMKSDIDTIQANIKKVDDMLAELQKKVLPKSLTRKQALDVNSKIEQILKIHNQSKEAAQKIADAFPNDAQAATAMKTLVDAGKSFGYDIEFLSFALESKG